MNTQLISVIIPLYNKADYIKRTLESVVIQDYKEVEIVVVNDGSTDNGAEIVMGMALDNVIIVNKENGGVSSARNAGVRASHGDWIFFLDGDDTIKQNCLSSLFHLHEKFPDSNVLCGNYTMKYPGCKESDYCKSSVEYAVIDNFRDFWYQRFFLRPGIVLMRKELFECYGYFNEEINVYEDYEFFIRMMDYCKIAYTPNNIFTYLKEGSEGSKGFSPSKHFFEVSLDNVNGYEKKVLMEVLVHEMITARKSLTFIKQLLNRNKNHLLYMLIHFVPCFTKCMRNAQVIQRFKNKFWR